jgi:hypothetical protein
MLDAPFFSSLANLGRDALCRYALVAVAAAGTYWPVERTSFE